MDRFVFGNQFLNKNSISRIRRNLSIHRRRGSIANYQLYRLTIGRNKYVLIENRDYTNEWV